MVIFMQTQINQNTIIMLNQSGIYRRFFKRPMDFLLALIAIVLLSPVMLIIAILVRIKLGKPILFKQERPGLNEEIFTIYKFRTMSDEKDENGEYLPDSQRLTKFGKTLRSLSLDELPELFNIIKGEMSFVGPRPLSVLYLPLYRGEERLRHSVRPGLTGLAQINGRNTLNWEERFAYDIEYVKNITFLTDIKILFKTIFKVFKNDGVVVSGTGKVIDFDEYRKL
jgi:undecaprenyl phosphate N,N'-diacetylbacillosamine 1-phosphate transferase